MSLFYSVEPVRHGTFDLEYVKPERPLNGLCEQLNAHGKSCGELSVEAAMRYIPENLPDFVFLYLGFPDEAGHMHGWMSDEYMRAVNRCWDMAEQVCAVLPEEYQVIFTTDHGGHWKKAYPIVSCPYIGLYRFCVLLRKCICCREIVRKCKLQLGD